MKEDVHTNLVKNENYARNNDISCYILVQVERFH